MKRSHKRWIFWSLFLSFFIYSFFVYTSGTSLDRKHNTFSGNVKLGKETFQKYNCISCHQVMGLGGYMGPDLTNVISSPDKGENYAKAFLLSGTERMPKFPMSNTEIEALIDYLEHIGKTVTYPLSNVKTTWYGTFETTGDE